MLEIALESRSHALVLLLLCNGYDPNLERDSPLDLALQRSAAGSARSPPGMGRGTTHVNLGDLSDSYSSELMERFRNLGVDLTASHEMAEALAYHTSNKPPFGFAKRHCAGGPKIQAGVWLQRRVRFQLS